ncbi:MAG: hypothetical protein IJA36_03955, partial [Lachnospiraceae bacterium]|nr:hypothetical protein [Lachnospiraceae bacterium]
MKKSKVALLLVAVCAALAGCGESTETTDTDAAVETAVEEGVEEVETEEAAAEEAETEEAETE